MVSFYNRFESKKDDYITNFKIFINILNETFKDIKEYNHIEIDYAKDELSIYNEIYEKINKMSSDIKANSKLNKKKSPLTIFIRPIENKLLKIYGFKYEPIDNNDIHKSLSISISPIIDNDKINGFIQAHASSIVSNMNKDDINLEQINAMTKIGTKLRATLYGDYFSKFKSLCESNGLIDNKTEVL